MIIRFSCAIASSSSSSLSSSFLAFPSEKEKEVDPKHTHLLRSIYIYIPNERTNEGMGAEGSRVRAVGGVSAVGSGVHRRSGRRRVSERRHEQTDWMAQKFSFFGSSD